MFPNRIPFRNLLSLAVVLILTQRGFAAGRSETITLDAGFRQMYNLDFAAAHKTFEAWQQLHPEDPLGPASNAAAYLFAEFDRLQILDSNVFIEDKKFEQRGSLSPDPKVKFEFQEELAKADDMVEKILSDTALDPNALFAKMIADGLRGDYAALVEKQKRAGLNFLKSSRTTAEKLIRIDPSCKDAYLALGIENYVLGIRSAPTRWMLRFTGAQTNKAKGLENLKITADKGRFFGPYARLLLAIAALRDDDKGTARKLLTDLAREFPQNRLYQIELARLQD
jgi:hypothetical protein